MTLDSLLTEVGPILNSSQFTHPSFREVLAARQFADEINSGRLSVNDAYLTLWSRIESLLPKKIKSFRTIDPSWKPVLTHMAGMLNEDKVKEFVDVVGESHDKRIKRLDRHSDNVLYGDNEVFEDLIFCTQFVRRFNTLGSPKGYPIKILETLLGLFYDYACIGHEYKDLPRLQKRAQKAIDALSLTRSEAVLESLKGFLDDNPNIHTYDSSDQIWFACGAAYRAVERIEEDRLIIEEGISTESDGAGHLDKLMSALLSPHTHNNGKRDIFWRAFGIIWKRGFSPDLIRIFNEKIATIKEGGLLDIYHTTLCYFASMMHRKHNVNLYDHLEKNKMQFWDYWKVYKPK